jgi:hypothetical protein
VVKGKGQCEWCKTVTTARATDDPSGSHKRLRIASRYERLVLVDAIRCLRSGPIGVV